MAGAIALLVGCTVSMCALAVRRSDQLVTAERATDIADLVALSGARFGPTTAAGLARANGAELMSWSDVNGDTIAVEVAFGGIQVTAHAALADRDSGG